MLTSVRFRAQDEYFKVGNIVIRRPAPGSPDMDNFRQRFFEMTGEPYDLYEARMEAQKAEIGVRGVWNRVKHWFTSWVTLDAPQSVPLKKENLPDGKTNPDDSPENR